MPHYLFDLYSAFTDSAFGGSHAGIIYDGEGLTTETMQQIAREVRAPATCFVMSAKDREVGVRFFSTAQEYPMCGHGTLALMTGLVSRGYLDISRGSSDEVTLRTPASSAAVTVDHQDDGRIEVMLNLEPAEFEPASIDKKTFERLFGAGAGDLDGSLPVEYTRSDFAHLVIPMSSLLGVQSLTPDFEQLANYCEQTDVDTVMVFCRETVEAQNTVHCREFAPRVGTPEVPAAGTTNRALACYLARHNLIAPEAGPTTCIRAEQGYEIQRPSLVVTRMTFNGNLPTDIWVGGFSAQVVRGQFSV